MGSYKELIEFLAQRQMGLLGRTKTVDIFREAGLELDGEYTLKADEADFGDMERLVNLLYAKYGPVVIMGCKLPVRRKARQDGLKLPAILG